MNQFDETTERKAKAYLQRCRKEFPNDVIDALEVVSDFTAGRNSAKESLEILARAAQATTDKCGFCHGKGEMIGYGYDHTGPTEIRMDCDNCEDAREAIAQVKARGDYPLNETKPGYLGDINGAGCDPDTK